MIGASFTKLLPPNRIPYSLCIFMSFNIGKWEKLVGDESECVRQRHENCSIPPNRIPHFFFVVFS